MQNPNDKVHYLDCHENDIQQTINYLQKMHDEGRIKGLATIVVEDQDSVITRYVGNNHYFNLVGGAEYLKTILIREMELGT